MTDAQIAAVDRFLQDAGLAGRALKWQALAYEMELNVSYGTIRRTMATLDYRKCIACQKCCGTSRLVQIDAIAISNTGTLEERAMERRGTFWLRPAMDIERHTEAW